MTHLTASLGKFFVELFKACVRCLTSVPIILVLREVKHSLALNYTQAAQKEEGNVRNLAHNIKSTVIMFPHKAHRKKCD